MLLFCMYLDARSARAGGPRGIERPKAKGRTGKGKGRGIRYPREFDLARVAGEKQTPKAKAKFSREPRFFATTTSRRRKPAMATRALLSATARTPVPHTRIRARSHKDEGARCRPNVWRRQAPRRSACAARRWVFELRSASGSFGDSSSFDSMDDDDDEGKRPLPSWLRALGSSSNVFVQFLRGALVSLESIAATVADIVLDLMGPDSGATRAQVTTGVRLVATLVLLVFVKSVLSTAILLGIVLLAVSALSFVIDRETGANNEATTRKATSDVSGRRRRAVEERRNKEVRRDPPHPPRDSQKRDPEPYGEGPGDGDLVDVVITPRRRR